MDQNGPFWPKEAHFGPFRSANRTLAIPDNHTSQVQLRCLSKSVRKQERTGKENKQTEVLVTDRRPDRG